MINSNTIVYFFLLHFFLCQRLPAAEYIYPVGYNEENHITYYIRQTEPLHIELYAFDTVTKEYTKLLPNYFNPAGFRLLPNKDGFSFIHNDTVYIKRFSKRSPKRIEFFEPIYGINAIEWIDETSFYFAARFQKHYRIYEGTIQGDLEIIVSDDTFDSLYPQKIDHQLFYIEQTSDKEYRIANTGYKTNNDKKIIAKVENQSIACLSMISTTRGFFLTYSTQVKPEDMIITFSYYQIKKNKEWEVQWLFNFSIPREFLDSPSRLYESVVPLLPQYKNGQLYFMSTSKNNHEITFFKYDFSQKKIFTLQKELYTIESRGYFNKK